MTRFAALIACVVLVALTGCGSQDEGGMANTRAVPVTTAVARMGVIEVEEPTVGRLEAPAVPTVSAETAGQIVRIRKDVGDMVEAGTVLAELDSNVQRLAVDSSRAALDRLQVLLKNQERTVERFENLAKEQSVAQSMLDDARAERAALAAQIREAQAKLEDAQHNLDKSTIRSPATATVQRRLVSVGDYVRVGDPLFELVSPRLLQAFLPYPERLADVLKTGQKVRLRRPGEPNKVAEGVINELRPVVGANNRSVDVIVNIENPGGWRSGGSVSGAVVTARREGILAPVSTIVRRPAGTVVYIVDGKVARQRVVQTGDRSGADIEIVAGLKDGEVLVNVGAGFLTDGAAIVVREPAAPAPASASANGATKVSG
jgi:RND family efflux transporter MFP subunit